MSSDKCGNCDCADVNQCVKKGNTYVVDVVEKSYVAANEVIGMPAAGEHSGNCKCGASCACTNCACGGSH